MVCLADGIHIQLALANLVGLQSDDLTNTDKNNCLFSEVPSASTIDLIINNRQKIDLTHNGMLD